MTRAAAAASSTSPTTPSSNVALRRIMRHLRQNLRDHYPATYGQTASRALPSGQQDLMTTAPILARLFRTGGCPARGQISRLSRRSDPGGEDQQGEGECRQQGEAGDQERGAACRQAGQ